MNIIMVRDALLWCAIINFTLTPYLILGIPSANVFDNEYWHTIHCQAHLPKGYASSTGRSELVVNPSEEAVTLEHIMPQTREPNWKHITAEQHKSYVKRIGNLALLDKSLNEYAGNLPFSDKSKAFAKSNISLTQEIGALPGWDLKAIDTRQERLAKLAVYAWPLKPR